MISFNFLDIPVFKLPKSKYKSAIKSLVLEESFKLQDISLIFVSDLYLLDINKKHLNHDYFTDIITFDYSKDSFVAGDLFISVDRVRENALLNYVDFNNELSRVVFHGVLHLCKYKDKTKADKLLMRSKEDYYLSKFLE